MVKKNTFGTASVDKALHTGHLYLMFKIYWFSNNFIFNVLYHKDTMLKTCVLNKK